MIVEEEFNRKMEAGEIEEVKGDSPQSSPEEKDTKTLLEPSIEDYEAALEEIRMPKSRARAYRTDADQIISTGAWRKVDLDAETYDNQGEYDSITNFRFTAKREGYYQVNGVVNYVSPVADKRFEIAIRKNGSEVSKVRIHSSIASPVGGCVSDIIHLKKDDYLELFTFHTAGVDETIYANTTLTYMTIHKLSGI